MGENIDTPERVRAVIKMYVSHVGDDAFLEVIATLERYAQLLEDTQQ